MTLLSIIATFPHKTTNPDDFGHGKEKNTLALKRAIRIKPAQGKVQPKVSRTFPLLSLQSPNKSWKFD